jgi:hypothetical protein
MNPLGQIWWLKAARLAEQITSYMDLLIALASRCRCHLRHMPKPNGKAVMSEAAAKGMVATKPILPGPSIAKSYRTASGVAVAIKSPRKSY